MYARVRERIVRGINYREESISCRIIQCDEKQISWKKEGEVSGKRVFSLDSHQSPFNILKTYACVLFMCVCLLRDQRWKRDKNIFVNNMFTLSRVSLKDQNNIIAEKHRREIYLATAACIFERLSKSLLDIFPVVSE